MEGNIDAEQGNGGRSMLKFEVAFGALELLGALEARGNDLALYLIHGEQLSQLEGFNQFKVIEVDVDLPHLKIVEDVRHSLQSDQFTGANILLTLHTKVKTCTAVTANKNLPRH